MNIIKIEDQRLARSQKQISRVCKNFIKLPETQFKISTQIHKNQSRSILWDESRKGELSAEKGRWDLEYGRKELTFLTNMTFAAAMAATTPPRMVTGPVRRLHFR